MPVSQAIDIPEKHPLSFEKRRIEMELQKKEYNDHYSTCCSNRTTDARLLQFSAKFSMSVLALGFAGVQLIRSDECSNLTPFYCSLITFILGAWVSDSAKQKISNPTAK